LTSEVAADVEWECPEIETNTTHLLDVFGEVHLISKGGACLSQLLELQDVSVVELKPTLILLDTPYEDRLRLDSRSRSASPHAPPPIEDEGQHEEELYGLALLQRIVSESNLRNLSKLVVVVPLIVFPTTAERNEDDGHVPDGTKTIDGSDDAVARRHAPATLSKEQRIANRKMVERCLDLGATDIMSSPMNVKCITNLEVHAYRAHRDAAREQKSMLEVRRGRKRSWVGISEEKPYAYLREAMVSGLMSRICRIDGELDDPIANVRISIPSERQGIIARAVGDWNFCAHQFTDDELIVVAAVMFNHALAMPELEKWRIPTDQLHSFLIACRAAYNSFVPYHNFRHVVDVLQATFDFLVHIEALPPFPATSGSDSKPSDKSPSAQVITPFEALTLLITAIGHDVGHPGVNNGFLSKLNAPLAQLYNDRSVLESFHCAAYSQILRRYWQAAFDDCRMRSLMISTILATDMALHFDYMKQMGDAQEKLHENKTIDGWDGRALEAHKVLICALLIKCADISNVARKHDTAIQWMYILSDEFSRQASMEDELKIPTSLMVKPTKDMVTLGKSQLGFMNLFALPLFQGVADLLPPMSYCVDALEANKVLFEAKVAEAQSTKEPIAQALRRHESGTYSPRTMSMVTSETKKASLPTQKLLAASAPALVATRTTSEKQFMTKPAEPADVPAHVPVIKEDYKEVNGVVTDFETVADFAASDPFHSKDGGRLDTEQQRCSETTEGSSAPYSAEWASGATSATTGKMPISPSTQGTSVISSDSIDRPVSVPVTTVTAPESTTTATESALSRTDLKLDEGRSQSRGGDGQSTPECSNGTLTAPSTGVCSSTLKKKPSRFRINGLHFFRRHKGTGSPASNNDTAE
jgi:hypothetical protein